ncbi:LysR family transcriptional regulator [Clostridium autoethanogenum]|uniref:HTH-type transcriptional regulator CynR n=3 Tax=Clostridium TaxID=1485 RepID=D8GRJ0_CLOLD|nr:MULTISPECIES: LysR family transcriptional regulator [Clostridium]OAA94661.1 HTH-type transcriptional regulator CynR [Clostridium coskatii]OVY52337.1 HTH-type transcriptional regulator CynR [Clostridium autoethanogenum]ADK16358.1 predicted transcriptional regulator, LysR family [Clostridium ljungdahlii DSM 13528]ALU35601.1 Transcriptional regulator LysR family [Clostridium autoethanogenum DSM 10061]OAA89768.1 HTH-type transcriptional regulator CynR [Clostridium ljungdahlii DSM 13528]
MFQIMNYVYEVYKCGSFSKASKNLHMTQPALSIAIRKLEQEIGQPLFQRKTSPLKLTDAGRIYMEKVEKIISMEQECTDYFQNLNEVKVGKVTIGGAIISMTYLLPELIVGFFYQYPGIEIAAKEASLPVLKSMLADGNIDLILDTNWFEEDIFQSIPLFTNQVLLAIPLNLSVDRKIFACGMTSEEIRSNKHLSQNQPAIDLYNMGNLPFLLLEPTNEIFGRSKAIFNYYHIEPLVKMSFNQQMTSFEFASKGLGAVFISDTLVKCSPNAQNLRFYKLNCPMPKREVSIAYSKKIYVTKATQRFIDYTTEFYKRKINH